MRLQSNLNIVKPRILSLFPNSFNKFDKTWALILYLNVTPRLWLVSCHQILRKVTLILLDNYVIETVHVGQLEVQ